MVCMIISLCSGGDILQICRLVDKLLQYEIYDNIDRNNSSPCISRRRRRRKIMGGNHWRVVYALKIRRSKYGGIIHQLSSVYLFKNRH